MKLIDADALIEAMKKTESEYKNAMTCPSWWSTFNVISEQPTVYSVGKVVEEIIEEAHNTIVDFKLDKYVSTCKAIEIVKQGDIRMESD